MEQMLKLTTVLFLACIIIINVNGYTPEEQKIVNSPCAAVRCANGYCVDEPNKNCTNPPCRPTPRCVPHSQTSTPKSTYEPTCSNIECPQGQHCELQIVQCIRAPCPPIPRCFNTSGHTCASARCHPCFMRKQCNKSGSCALLPICGSALESQT